MDEQTTSKKNLTRNRIIALVFTAILILVPILCFQSCKAHPEKWLPQCRENREAIVSYAKKHYPNATIVEEIYNSSEFNPTNNPSDVIIFELDGIQFSISAKMGEITPEVDDLYGSALLSQEIRQKYLDDFNNRYHLNIDPGISFWEYIPKSTDTLDTYNGHLFLDFVLQYEQGANNPRQLGWIYNFYCYWKESYPRSNYTIRFVYIIDEEHLFELELSSKEDFVDENSFYDAFVYSSNK